MGLEVATRTPFIDEVADIVDSIITAPVLDGDIVVEIV